MNAQRRDEQLVHGGATILADPDAGLVQRLRDGDEAAFMTLVDRHAAAMLRVASMYVPRALAEEVVQDTWLAVLDGIDRTEPIGRPSEAPVAMLQAPQGVRQISEVIARPPAPPRLARGFSAPSDRTTPRRMLPRARGTVPFTLLSDPTPLIDRDRELEVLRRHLLENATRLLTLLGPGGIG